MKFVALLLSTALVIGVAPVTGCSQRPAESVQSREAIVVFGSAIAALEVLDLMHAKRMRDAPDPTDEEFARAQAFSDKLHRLRDALAITRAWLSGEQPQQVGRQALFDAASVLQLLVDELRSENVAIPETVDLGLAALKAFA